MERFFIFDNINTWYDWRLILSKKEITPSEPKTNYLALDGMSGTLDLSDCLTGEITYNDRKISLVFWTSEGDYKSREKLIRDITKYLHGKKLKMIEPDDTNHYFVGRAKITAQNNNVAYAEISIECTCEPWRYSVSEITRAVTVNSQDVTNLIFNNNGMKSLSPIISVTGNIELIYNDTPFTLTDGDYQIPDVKLYQGVNTIGVTGSGNVTFSYREAEI